MPIVGKIYECAICGNAVKLIANGNTRLVCCGEIMTELSMSEEEYGAYLKNKAIMQPSSDPNSSGDVSMQQQPVQQQSVQQQPAQQHPVQQQPEANVVQMETVSSKPTEETPY